MSQGTNDGSRKCPSCGYEPPPIIDSARVREIRISTKPLEPKEGFTITTHLVD